MKLNTLCEIKVLDLSGVMKSATALEQFFSDRSKVVMCLWEEGEELKEKITKDLDALKKMIESSENLYTIWTDIVRCTWKDNWAVVLEDIEGIHHILPEEDFLKRQSEQTDIEEEEVDENKTYELPSLIQLMSRTWEIKAQLMRKIGPNRVDKELWKYAIYQYTLNDREYSMQGIINRKRYRYSLACENWKRSPCIRSNRKKIRDWDIKDLLKQTDKPF